MAARLELLGGFTLRSSSGEDITPTSKKACALLARLALRSDRATSRGAAAALLWEESGDSQARASLRQALAAVRRALPAETVIRCEGETLVLAPGVHCDVAALEEIRADAEPELLERVANLYRGDLLEGFDARAPAFEEWVAVERERLRRLAESRLTRLLDHHRERGDAAAAANVATRILHLDPLREDVHRALMELYARLGRRAAALNQYRTCRRTLERMLGVDPEPETEALRRSIENDRRRRIDEPDHVDTPVGATSGSSPTAEGAPEPAEPDRRLREVTVVTALAVPADGSAAPEELAVAEDELVAAMTAVVAGLGGKMIRPGPDGAVAAFGAALSHGNEPQRAVRAALTLVRRLEGGCCRPRIGLAAGLMLVGGDEGASVSGEPARRAAELAARAAPGAVLADVAVRESMGGRLVAEPSADGWLVHGLHPVPEEPHPLVGRAAECRQLEALLADCRDEGRGQVIVLRGEAGIGKTRLLRAVLGAATEVGFTAHLVTILDFGSPDDVEHALAAQLLGLGGEPDLVATLAAADGAVASGLVAAEDRQALLALLGAGEVAGSTEDGAGVALRRSRLLPRLMRRATGSGPRLVAVEDAHWAPPRVRLLLARLAAATADSPAVLLLTTRADGDPVDAAWRATAAPSALTMIDLGPLRREDLAALAREHRDVDARTLEGCIQRAEGNPLFFHQLVRAAESGADELPGTVRSLVTSRMDRLPERDRLALEAAATLGQRFQLETVGELAGDPGWDPSTAAGEGLLRPEEEGWTFVHSLIRDAVYTSTPRDRRRSLHHLAARWFADRSPALEAEHLAAAADPRAAAAWLRAAQRELGRHRAEVALELAEKGLSAAPEPAVLHVLQLLRGESLELLGEAAAAVDAFRSALAVADEAGGRVRARLGLASALRRAEQHREALVVLDEAHRDLAGDDEGIARLETIRSSIHFTLGDLEACVESTGRALEASRRAGSAASEARALGALGDAEYHLGRVARAHDHFDACIRLAEANGLEGVVVAHLGMRGLTRLYRLRTAEALADVAEAARRAAALGHLRAEMVAHNVAVTVELEAGRTENALISAERSLELAGRLGSRLFEADNLNVTAHALGVLERRAEARELAARSWEISRECGPGFSGPWILATLAWLCEDDGERQQALAEGESLLAKGSTCHGTLHFHQLAIHSALEKGRWSEARRHADALSAYRGTEPFEMAELLTDMGHTLADVGEGDRRPEVLARVRELRRTAEDAGLVLAARFIGRFLQS